jgi:hypothetical protein
MELALQAREPGWWMAYDDLQTSFPYIGMAWLGSRTGILFLLIALIC